MKRKSINYYIFLFLTLVVSLIGCGKREKEESEKSTIPSQKQSTPAKTESSTPPAGNDLSTITTQNAETLKAMNQDKDIEPLSTDTLKTFLPDTLAGMIKNQSDARQMGLLGINVASAQADYDATSGSGTLSVTIMDLGNVSGPMRMGMTGWTLSQFDRKTDTGYEKTTTYKDHKALEEYDNQDQHGEFRIFVGDRFVVEITGDNVMMETLKQAMDQIDLKKLIETAK